MKFGKLILFLSLAAVAMSAHGQFPGGDFGVSKDLMEKIMKAQSELKNMSETKDCKFPDNPDCTTKSLCEGLVANSRSLYLYKNAEGRGIPNLQLLKASDSLEGCFKKKMPDMTQDPFLNPKGFLKNSKAWQDEQAKHEPLFENTKAEIIKVLEARKDGKNNTNIDNLIKRIKTVKLKSIAGDEAYYITRATCSVPNAAYDYNSHSLLICPQLYRYPEASLETVIAHELGHVIDPCIAGGDLKETANGDVIEFSHQEKVPGKILSTAIPYDSNPFKDNVMKCLSDKKSMAVISKSFKDYDDELMISEQEYEAYINDRAEDPSVKNELARVQKQRTDLKTNYKFQQQCSWFKTSGDAQESFADWVAAQVKKSKLSQIKDPAKAKIYALESEGIFLSYSCGEVKQRVLSDLLSQFDTSNARQVQARCYDLVKAGPESHPEGADRIDKIHLATPEMQKALGCKPDKTVPDCK